MMDRIIITVNGKKYTFPTSQRSEKFVRNYLAKNFSQVSADEAWDCLVATKELHLPGYVKLTANVVARF